LENSIQQFPRAEEDDYVILENPSEDGNFPAMSGQSQGKNLKHGHRIVIPGPWTNAMYPGQSAQVVPGHRLRTNQYLIVAIYNEEEAKKNWKQAVVKTAAIQDAEDVEVHESCGLPKPDSFTVGTRIVIKGTDVSFFIPPTGVEVLRDEQGNCVREAVTLGQLEYCCLISESGKKEFPRGPKVVFPLPIQVFDQDRKGNRKFRPIELNTINGIQLKVTADFEGEDLEKAPGTDGKRHIRKYKEGEELFVKGTTLQIYYPREELAIIEYGQGNRKHYSTAIPEGEGRYVLEREKGVIRTMRGPKMLLPDPRTEIIVRKVLSPNECDLMYPGNTEAKRYNQELGQAISEQPSGRSGFVSEGDYQKRMRKAMKSSLTENIMFAATSDADYETEDAFQPESVGKEGHTGGTVTRGTTYTQPRQITLNTKYDGVPKINIWSGYAVLILGATDDKRRVEVGPATLLLDYDETFGFMNVSTGKPKSTDKLLKIGYLQIHQNQVGDIIDFESKDHVRGKLKISLRVNFEAETDSDRLKWFSVDNYVKFLCDHVRSIIAGMAKRHTIAELKSGHIDIVRNAILGEKPEDGSKRPGLTFEANGMRVVEVEVFPLTLEDPGIAQMLAKAEFEVVESDIHLDQERKRLAIEQETQKILREKMQEEFATVKVKSELEEAKAKLTLRLALARLKSDLDQVLEKQKIQIEQQKIEDSEHNAVLTRKQKETDQQLSYRTEDQKLKLDSILKETEAAVARFKAAEGGLNETLTLLQRDDIAVKLASACNIERYISGDNTDSAIARLLTGFPILAEFMNGRNGNGNRLTQPASR
jgi:major vault protein